MNMEFINIRVNDPLMDVLFEFKRNKLCIDNMSLDQVKVFGIHAIRCKGDINDINEASRDNIAQNTMYFHKSKTRMEDLAYYLSKAINEEVKIGTDDNGNRFYLLETNVKNKNAVGLRGLVECDKLLLLCQAVKDAIREKVQE